MATLIIAAISILLALEVFIAFILYPLKHGINYYRLITSDEDIIFKFDRDIGYLLKPNLIYRKPTPPHPNAPRRILNVDVQTGKNGFLFTEDLAKLKEKYKLIFCIGASTTAGLESRHDKTYPAILDSLVKEHGYRCINAGIGGYRSIHELLYFKKKILPHKPSAIIIFSGYNDFEDFAYDFYEPYNQFRHCLSHYLPINTLEQLLNYSAIFHISKRLIYKFSGKIRTETPSDSSRDNLRKSLKINAWLDEWRNNIGKIIDLCKEHSIQCYLVSHVSPVYENAPKEAKDFSEKDLNMNGRFEILLDYIKLIHNATVGLARGKGIKFIEITSDFDRYYPDGNEEMQYKKRFSLFTDRMHFTEEGNFLLAKSIYGRIKEDL